MHSINMVVLQAILGNSQKIGMVKKMHDNTQGLTVDIQQNNQINKIELKLPKRHRIFVVILLKADKFVCLQRAGAAARCVYEWGAAGRSIWTGTAGP